MSWNSLANNQTVSYNNLIDAVNIGYFTEINSIPSSSIELNAYEASYYVNIDTSYTPYASKSTNQLVVKSNLLPIVKLLATGKVGSTYGLLQSTNSGVSFSVNTQVTGAVVPLCVAASANGQYIIVGRNGYSATPGSGRLSTNYGSTFSDLTTYVPSTENITMAAISSSGQYMVFARSDENTHSSSRMDLYTSSNYGSTFTLTLTADVGTWWWPNGISMSSDGSRILIVSNNNSGAITITSTNYGASWSTNSFGISTAFPNVTTGSGMSTSGQYQLAAWTSSGSSLYVSSDYGSNWTNKSPVSNVQWVSAAVSNTGKYMLACTSAGYLYKSSDYGNSWSIANGGSALPYEGSVMFMTNEQTAYFSPIGSVGYFYISNDYGNSWSTKSSSTYLFGPTIAI